MEQNSVRGEDTADHSTGLIWGSNSCNNVCGIGYWVPEIILSNPVNKREGECSSYSPPPPPPPVMFSSGIHVHSHDTPSLFLKQIVDTEGARFIANSTACARHLNHTLFLLTPAVCCLRIGRSLSSVINWLPWRHFIKLMAG